MAKYQKPLDLGHCRACGDSLPKQKEKDWLTIEGRKGRYCRTCFNELAHGVIRNQNIQMSGGSPARMDDDIGSYRTNAVRAMEDR